LKQRCLTVVHDIADHLEVVGVQSGPRRGDIGNGFGCQIGDGALGRALTVHQLVIRHAMIAQEITHQTVVFGGNPQAEAMCLAEGCSSGVQIIQAVHIHPSVRHRQNQIRMAKAQFRQRFDLLFPLAQLFAHQIGARDTQMDATSGQFAGDFSLAFDRDGSSAGELVRTEITEDGTLFGVFDNGMRRALYDIPVAVVANPNGLVEVKGNAYRLSGETGSFSALQANSSTVGSINAGALEGSNVDIAQEMTDLIKAQRAFSTNAKVITTVDDMMDETTRLKR